MWRVPTCSYAVLRRLSTSKQLVLVPSHKAMLSRNRSTFLIIRVPATERDMAARAKTSLRPAD